jgi:hypothetical protein
MRMFRASRVLFLNVVLAAYAVDCAALTEQQAMQCCRSMSLRCSSHHHRSTDCCKTMLTLRAALGRPSGVHSGLITPAAIAIVGVSDGIAVLQSSSVAIEVNSHGPPGSFSPPILSLRI